MKLSDFDKKIKMIVEAGFPFGKKDDEKDDKKDGAKDTEKKDGPKKGENPFAKKDDAEDKDSEGDDDSEESDDDEDEDDDDKDSAPSKAPEAPSGQPKSEAVPTAPNPTEGPVTPTDIKKSDAQPVAKSGSDLTTQPQQYLTPNPPMAPNATPAAQPADAAAQVGGQSVLAKELGNFVETAKALKGVLDVLKDFAQPTIVQQAAPAPMAPAPGQPPAAPMGQPAELSPELKKMDADIMAKVSGGQTPPQEDLGEEPAPEGEEDPNAMEGDAAAMGDEEPEAIDGVYGDPNDETAPDDATADEGEPDEAAKGLTDEIKAAFKIKPGTKKYDPATNQVYWKLGDVLMVAPADNPEDESQVDDEDTIASVGL